jgi:hypothetical protein
VEHYECPDGVSTCILHQQSQDHLQSIRNHTEGPYTSMLVTACACPCRLTEIAILTAPLPGTNIRLKTTLHTTDIASVRFQLISFRMSFDSSQRRIVLEVRLNVYYGYQSHINSHGLAWPDSLALAFRMAGQAKAITELTFWPSSAWPTWAWLGPAYSLRPGQAHH